MRKNVDSPKNSVTDIILRYGLLRDGGLKSRILEELSATGNFNDARYYSQTAHEIFVAVGSEYIHGSRPVTSDITNLTGIPKSSARRGVSFLERIDIVTQSADPTDGRRHFIELTEPYQRIVDSFVDDCAIEFADIINLFDKREREEADRKYQSLFNNTAVGIGRLRLSDEKIILTNEKLADLFGAASVDEFVEEFVFSDLYVDQDERTRLIEHYKRNPGQITKLSHILPDGSDIYVETSGQVDKESGDCDFVFMDITERKHAEDKLQKKDEDYRSLFETSQEGINFASLEGKLEMCNDAFCNLVGYSLDELQTMTYQQLTPEKWHAIEAKIIEEQVMRKGYSDEYEKEYIRKDGTIIAIAIRACLLRDKDGNPERMVGLVSDITERKRTEEALRESEEKMMALLLSSTAEAIYGLDVDGNCTFVNQSCLGLLGYENEVEVLGKNMHNLVHHTKPDGSPYPLAECRIYEAFRRGEGMHVCDEVLWRKDATRIPVEYWSYPIRKNGEVTGAVVSFLDITERQPAEDQFLKSLPEKEMLIGKIHHRVKI